MRGRGRTWALAVALAVVSVAGPAVAQTYRYRVEWGSVRLVTAEVTVTRTGERWEVRGDGTSAGPAAWFFDWEGFAESAGVVTADGLVTRRHVNGGRLGERQRSASVTWPDGRGGTPVTVTDLPADPAKETPIPPGSTAGTVDPFAALLTILDGLGRGGRCDGTYPVFDGRRRYDLTVKDVGRLNAPADRGPGTWSGPATGCAISSRPLGGFPIRPTVRTAPNARRLVYAARLANGSFAPIRIEVETSIGMVVGRLLRK